MSEAVDSSDIDGVHQEVFSFDKWTITSLRSHILESKCIAPFVCSKSIEKCLFCRFQSLLAIPHFPDMTYARNGLKIVHQPSGFTLEFNCIDALKLVKHEFPSHLVAAAEEWQKYRGDFSKVKKNPFDWTFTTPYQGSIMEIDEQDSGFVDTSERIDIEKLKVKEEILYYDDVHLFEDELSDHGVAKCSVKIRVMKSSFFILLRFFLRIDNVLVRLHDTRVYHEFGSDHLLKEFTIKEALLSEINFPTPILTDPNELNNRLPSKEVICKKLTFQSNINK